MADSVEPVTITTPTGAILIATLGRIEPGIWRASTRTDELGLWRATDGKLTAAVNVGPALPRAFAEVTSTAEVRAALAAATGGEVCRIAAPTGSGAAMPSVVCSNQTFRAEDWIRLKMGDSSVVRGIGALPFIVGLLGALLLLGSLAANWLREGR